MKSACPPLACRLALLVTVVALSAAPTSAMPLGGGRTLPTPECRRPWKASARSSFRNMKDR